MSASSWSRKRASAPTTPLSGEKLSLVLTVYRARDFRHAKEIASDILEFQGKGHSLGLHTNLLERARELAEDMPVVRVLVNQAHTFANGGGFDSGLPFTLSMGCGSWGGNSISENLNYRHFINVTHLVTSIAEDKNRPRTSCLAPTGKNTVNECRRTRREAGDIGRRGSPCRPGGFA